MQASQVNEPTVAVPPGVVTVMVTVPKLVGGAGAVTAITLPLSEVTVPSVPPKLTVALDRFAPEMVTVVAAHPLLWLGLYELTVGAGTT